MIKSQMQFKAGYIIDSIAKVIADYRETLDRQSADDLTRLDQINGLLQYASSFDVEFSFEYPSDFTKLNPVLATLNNIITRGLPTRAPVLLEELFSKIGLTEPNKDEYELNYPTPVKQINYKTIFELLHIIEPGLQIPESRYAGKPGSKSEWLFLHEKLKDYPFTKQILQSQRDFATINRDLGGGRSVDFSFEFPYLNSTGLGAKQRGIIFEYDGQQHEAKSYKYYDNYRDAAADEKGFETLRQPSDKLELDPGILSQFRREIFQIFKINYTRDPTIYITEYSLLFIPIAVARIQKTIIEYFISNPIELEKEVIKIAIIERDLPCGAIALKSLKELVENINEILENDDTLKLPELKLTIFENKNWVIDSFLHLNAIIENEEHFKLTNFDIIIDHSILRRSNIYQENNFQQHKEKTIKIRSAHFFDTAFGKTRRVYCADLLHYKSLVKKNDDGSYNPVKNYEPNINYFIQNIFRKVSFREGQLPIISRALQLRPVIGLLTTGGGKSLTFQLPTFLQPGLCLVVDPIKSLMEDQVRVLKLNWIDCCDYINSNQKREEKTQKLIDFRYGETMFLFVSPERFVMQEFRHIIQNIDSSNFGLAFSYCVIDEVHCVSEWGHDFRTTYLMLGKNSQRFAKTKSKKAVSLIGLTATASFDVLTDIERELSINSDDVNDAVISIDNTIRPELFFSVIENEKKATSFPITSQSLKDTIGFAKQSQLNKQIENILETLNSINDEVVAECLSQHFTDFELNFNIHNEKHREQNEKVKNKILESISLETIQDVITVIFCPHTTGTFGITESANPFPKGKELFENLVIPIENKGYFMGGEDKIKKHVIENAQKFFLNFMQGKINYMVCTKAFGMGIDKEHIRSIYHMNFSSSPESYIQEAGRAGRDKVKSICSIFIDRNEYYTVARNFIMNNSTPQTFPYLVDRKKAREIFENYDSFQNRISEKYYGDVSSLKQCFEGIGLELTTEYIQRFNQDLSIHEYFHSNSFKGIKREAYQLNRLLNYNSGINTTQLNLLQEKYNLEFDEDIRLSLTLEGEYSGNLWLSSNNIAFGKIKTNKNSPTFTTHGLGDDGIADVVKTQSIFNFLIDDWDKNGRTDPFLFSFLQKEVMEGLNDGLTLIEHFEITESESFWFKVPSSFNNINLESRLVQDFVLNKLPIIDTLKATEDFINTLKQYSENFDDFILRIEEQWDVNIITNPVYIQNKKEYERYYYSEINKADVSRIMYRLYSIGFIEDYTIDYNLGIFSFEVFKSDKQYYIEKTQTHFLKYLSRTITMKKVDNLINSTLELSVFETIKKCVKEILFFTYDDIVKKRKNAVEDLFKFITESLDHSKQKENRFAFKNFWYNYHFKDEMYYYFNAKYAREGFKIANEPYSLLDDTEKGQISNWETFEKYAKALNDQSSFISECKMMRGSCRRIWRTLYKDDYEREFILKLLSSFATFGLNNKFYYQEAEDLFIDGFIILYEHHRNYKLFKSKIINFEMHLYNSTSNKSYLPYLLLAKHKIMLKVNSKFAKAITKQLNTAL